MTAKEYLQQIRLLDLKIDQKIEERQELIHRKKFLRDPDPRLEKDILERIERYKEEREEIIRTILSLSKPQRTKFLFLRYVKGLPLEKILYIMRKSNGKAYSYNHIRTIHSDALKEISEKLHLQG